jgi:hypothetical protein
MSLESDGMSPQSGAMSLQSGDLSPETANMSLQNEIGTTYCFFVYFIDDTLIFPTVFFIRVFKYISFNGTICRVWKPLICFELR